MIYIKSLIIFTCMLLLYSACKKNDFKEDFIMSSNKSSDYVSLVNGRLVFQDSLSFARIIKQLGETDTIEDYFQKWEDSLSFNSLRKSMVVNYDTVGQELYPDLISSFLNQDSIVQIGNRIYMISLATGFIYIIPDGDASKISYFSQKQNIPNVVIQFPIEKEGAYEVDYSNYQSFLKACPDTAAPSQLHQFSPNQHYSYNNVEYRFSGRSKYTNAGVVFTLFTKIEHHRKAKLAWVGQKTFLYISDVATYTPKCAEQRYNQGVRQLYDDDLNITRYVSTTALKQYELRAEACWVKIGAVPIQPTGQLPLTCHPKVTHLKHPN